MTDEPSTRQSRDVSSDRRSRDAGTSRRSRRAVLGLTAGTLASVAGCTDLGSGSGPDDEPTADPTDEPTDEPTDDPTPTGRDPDGSPTPIDPEDVALTGTSVQSSALGRHIMGGYLSLRRSDGWLVYVALGADGHTPEGNSRAFQHAPGYPERGALRLSVQAADQVVTYEESRRRNYTLVGDAEGAWTMFELPGSIQPDEAAVEWPARDRTIGTLSDDALAHLGRDPPAFTLESFVVGDPGTTPGPTPHQSPSASPGREFPTTDTNYEMQVRNEGGAGRFRGGLDHDTPKEDLIADYSQGGARLTAAFEAGEERTLTGGYTVYHRENQATVPVRAETAGGEVTSRVATDD